MIAVVALFLVGAGLVPEATAQARRSTLREIPENRREGFWFSIGLGAGNEAFDIAGEPGGFGDDVTGPSLMVKLGGTVSQSFTLGGELYGWTYDDAFNVRETLGSAMLVGQWYPARRGAFFVKGGLGLGFFQQESDDRFGYILDEETGFAAVIGAGYDIRVGRNVSITPTLDLYGHSYSDFRERIVNIGVAVTLH